MADIPEYDLTKDDMGAGEGAKGGGDENLQDYNFLGEPTKTPYERRRWWKERARPKDPYRYDRVPQDDEGNPMSTFPKEKSGLPSTSKDTAETSFIERNPLGRVRTADSMKMELAHQTISNEYPEYGKDGKLFTLEVQDGKVVVIGTKGGLTNLFKAYGRTLNSQLLKLKNVQQTLGPKRTELIQQKDQEIEQTYEAIAELDKQLQEYQEVIDNENEETAVRERARDKYNDKNEEKTRLVNKRDQAVRERDQLAEKLPLRERLKNLFKKHGFTIATVFTAVGITIGVLAKILADGASAATNGIKTVGKKVGDGLKELGKRIGSILPGLVGAIASFVFRAAGQAISFLAKNA